jgi:hypothetical protein
VVEIPEAAIPEAAIPVAATLVAEIPAAATEVVENLKAEIPVAATEVVEDLKAETPAAVIPEAVVILRAEEAEARRVMKAMTTRTNSAMTRTKIRSEAAAVIPKEVAAEDHKMKILTPAQYWKIKNSSKM